MTVRPAPSPGPSRALLLDVTALAAARALLSALLLGRGFTHVSDDDYARTVIAQAFAHAPRLDPSGSSWLPLPFWLVGSAMVAFGRSLAVARGAALVLGCLSAAAPYLGLRALGVPRFARLLATALAITVPWNLWLGAATVPEGWSGALAAAGILAMARPRGTAPADEGDLARFLGSLALLAASLSRYEAWPVAITGATCALLGALHSRRPLARIAAAAISVLGPVTWLVWNRHAHGDALHFLARVTRFRRAHLDVASLSLEDRWLTYPRALLFGAPFVALAAACGAGGLLDRKVRRRWAVPLLAAALQVAFLVYGDIHDGAPTHHPERALVTVWWLLAGFGADASAAFGARALWAKPAYSVAFVAALTTSCILWATTLAPALRDFPGRAEDGHDDRAAQVARGQALARSVASGSWGPFQVVLTPCAYEHFAFLAAFGAPERVDVREPTQTSVTADCPRVSGKAVGD